MICKLYLTQTGVAQVFVHSIQEAKTGQPGLQRNLVSKHKTKQNNAICLTSYNVSNSLSFLYLYDSKSKHIAK